MPHYLVYAVLVFSLLLPTLDAAACPKIGRLIDYNCDGRIKISITGDSIVRGVGDETVKDEGYLARLREKFPFAAIANLGVPGITSQRLYRAFKVLLQNPRGETYRKSQDADLFIVEVGPNDYWQKENPALTVRNIHRIVRLLKTALSKDGGIAPYFVIATLLPTKRNFQAPFIAEVNNELLRTSSPSFPVAIRFDKVSLDLLSDDGLHPLPEGYDTMAAIAENYIRQDLQKTLKRSRKDADRDGIYDYFEKVRYFTSPLDADSDNDGVADGAEVFVNHTDPLTPDAPAIP